MKKYSIEASALFTFLGIALLFLSAIAMTLVFPQYAELSWVQPTSEYQWQIYEVADPNLYISSTTSDGKALQFVYHLKKGFTLSTFRETNVLRIVAPPELSRYVTRLGERPLKLTSSLLLLRPPEGKMAERAEILRTELQQRWIQENPDWKEQQLPKIDYTMLELYAPKGEEAFGLAFSDGVLENWVEEDFTILDKQEPYHENSGVIYVSNPEEYRVSYVTFGADFGWVYDPLGEPIQTLEQLTSPTLGFHSRKELIETGEKIFAIEGCWYCHTDQSRTLVQDLVANGSDSYPAPPSSSSEYIYQKISFPGTRRIGPDLSRVGVKRPSRDWHMSHFWSPKTESKGSVMPSFQHFFDHDPRGTSRAHTLPNFQFEAVYQYLMTKGTRLTAPTQAWWLGRGPVQTLSILDDEETS